MTDALDHTMPFGKYRGTTLREIAEKDRGYLEWAAGIVTSDRLRTAIEETLNSNDVDTKPEPETDDVPF